MTFPLTYSKLACQSHSILFCLTCFLQNSSAGGSIASIGMWHLGHSWALGINKPSISFFKHQKTVSPGKQTGGSFRFQVFLQVFSIPLFHSLDRNSSPDCLVGCNLRWIFQEVHPVAEDFCGNQNSSIICHADFAVSSKPEKGSSKVILQIYLLL